MKKTKKLKEKALRLIDAMCESESLIYLKQDALGNVIESRESLFIAQVYKLAHAASDTECLHPEWEEEIEVLYKDLLRTNLL